ncbi:MAG: hypothetical protein ACLQU2_10965 [Candidatus Binataceae bacterium]
MATSFNLSTAIALLALIFSAITLWYSLLRPPRISSVVGPEIRIYYPPDGGLGLYVPVTFLNQSPRTGTVWRCAVTLYSKTSGERFFMDWRYFFRLKPEGDGFMFDEIASALAVPGKLSLSKLIWFSWRSLSTPPLRIAAVEYVMVFHYWTGPTGKPHNDSHEFSIDQGTYEQLERARTNKNARVFEIALDKTLAANLVMSSRDAKDRLGIE